MGELSQGTIYDVNGTLQLRGDFISFTFDGVHSSELGIVRISGGERYEDALTPSSSLQTTTVPGGDGTYYFGMNYTQRSINMNFAFDSLTQSQLARLSSIFGTRKIVSLIFDESPYKVFNVKVAADPRLTYLCFDENGERVYKGEGSINFICYSPFAYSRYKYYEDYTEDNIKEWTDEYGYNYNNLDEWIESSGIRTKTYNGILYDTYNITTAKINLWNGGQLPTDFNLYIPFADDSTTIPAFYIELDNVGDQLFFKEITKENENDKFIKINTKTNLVEGVNQNKKITGSVYNKYIEKGNFFKIPVGEQVLHTSAGIANEEIEYKFLYY